MHWWMYLLFFLVILLPIFVNYSYEECADEMNSAAGNISIMKIHVEIDADVHENAFYRFSYEEYEDKIRRAEQETKGIRSKYNRRRNVALVWIYAFIAISAISALVNWAHGQNLSQIERFPDVQYQFTRYELSLTFLLSVLTGVQLLMTAMGINPFRNHERFLEEEKKFWESVMSFKEYIRELYVTSQSGFPQNDIFPLLL